MKKYFILFLIPVLFTACVKTCEDEYETCTSEQLKWLCYYGHETLIFKRNDGLLDTLTASERVFGFYQLYPALNDNHHCAKYGQRVLLTISGKQMHAGLETMSFDAPRMYLDSSIYGLNGNLNDNISINGTLYNQVNISHVYDTTHISSQSIPKIWRIYFSSYYGLLRMDCTKGMYWEKIN